MKKVVSYLIILALFTGFFGTTLRSISNEIETPVISSILELVCPAAALADTVGDPNPPPPPPTD